MGMSILVLAYLTVKNILQVIARLKFYSVVPSYHNMIAVTINGLIHAVYVCDLFMLYQEIPCKYVPMTFSILS